MEGRQATAKTQFLASYRHFLGFKYTAPEGKGSRVSLLFKARVHSFTASH